VLLVAGAEDDWREFSLRHSVRVAVLAGALPVLAELRGRQALEGCDLLFAIDRSGEASFLGDWLDVLAVRSHHLLQPGGGLEPSLAAAARRLAGRSIGLVLSGGGARAFAHIGVLDELLAAGFSIDRVGGCSMGAFVGSMFALGMEPDEIDARCYEDWVRRNPLKDYRIPRHSLVRGEKVQAMLSRDLPGMIEELPRDFFCVSGDLPTADLVVHRRGPLWMAVGASMSLPGLVTPALLAGRMLVDGGVLNNLPVDVMAATGEGPVIGVDVTSRFEPPTAAEPDGAGFGRRRRAASEQVPVPGFTETLIRALTLGSADTVEAACEHADLVITPNGEGVGILDFLQLDRMREVGRRAAAEALAAGVPRLVE
jgi:NTE family protein